MARRVFLHIGTMKTGTSYLQRLWWHHRDELARRGLLVPGELEYDHRFAAMVVRDGAEALAGRLTDRQLGAWERILAETAATGGDAIISNEIFCNADAGPAREALRRLDGVAEEVHVVLTARDLGRILPSAWQQRIQQGRAGSFERYWRRARSEGPDGTFRRHYDLAGILDRWTDGVPPERVHVVVHPRGGAPKDWLWHRMCEVTGVDPSGLATDIGGARESLGLAEIEVLRSLNAILRSRWSERRITDLAGYLRRTLVPEVLVPAEGERFVAPPEALVWAGEEGRCTADLLASRDYDVVGDPADLVPDVDQPGRTPADVTPPEVARAALDALAWTVVRGYDQDQEIRELHEEVRRLRAASDGAGRPRLWRVGALGRATPGSS